MIIASLSDLAKFGGVMKKHRNITIISNSPVRTDRTSILNVRISKPYIFW